MDTVNHPEQRSRPRFPAERRPGRVADYAHAFGELLKAAGIPVMELAGQIGASKRVVTRWTEPALLRALPLCDVEEMPAAVAIPLLKKAARKHRHDVVALPEASDDPGNDFSIARDVHESSSFVATKLLAMVGNGSFTGGEAKHARQLISKAIAALMRADQWLASVENEPISGVRRAH